MLEIYEGVGITITKIVYFFVKKYIAPHISQSIDQNTIPYKYTSLMKEYCKIDKIIDESL